MTEPNTPDDDTLNLDPVGRKMAAILADVDHRAFLKASEREQRPQETSPAVDEVIARQYEDAIERAMWTLHQDCIILRPGEPVCRDHTNHRTAAAAVVGLPPLPVI